MNHCHRADLPPAIDAAVVAMIAAFNVLPTRAGFEDLGITAQMLQLAGDTSPALRRTRDGFIQAVSSWAQQGLIEDIFVTEVVQIYPGALICGLARGTSSRSGFDVLETAVAAMVGRCEWPSMTSRLISRSLGLSEAECEPTDMLRLADKRVLRSQTTAEDLEVLLQIAHFRLLDAEDEAVAPVKSLLADTLLLQALLVGDAHWLAILGFLFKRVFSPVEVLRAPICRALAAAPMADDRLLLPTTSVATSHANWGSRAAHRLRATIALQCFLEAQDREYAS